ncbi:MAG: cache domain-containing protein [Campylobacteraceae bacterium]|nr:cache domain-containing protein [Campylobacteraceae bacterium]
MKKITAKSKLLFIVLISVVIVSIISVMSSIGTIESISDDNIEDFKKEVFAKKEKELENYVRVIINTVESFYSRTSKEKIQEEVKDYLTDQMGFLYSIINSEYIKNRFNLSRAQLRVYIKSLIQETRYGKYGYFWINDLEAKMIMHPIMPNLNGQDLFDWQDKNGKKIFKEFAKIANEDERGFVEYVWPKPGFETPQPKISYVRIFRPFNWVIGTGEYVTDVTKKLQAEALKTISEIRYADNGYFWINDSSPKMIMHPIQPELDGTDLSSYKDSEGTFLFNEFVKVANKNKDGGIVKYLWPKPGKDMPQPKFSYVKKFEQWDWIVGTGAYVDDVDDKIINMRKQTKSNIKNLLVTTAIVVTLLLVMISLITLVITSKRKDNY